jgi:hypothetical protein
MLLIPGILASKFVPQGDFESIATVVVGSGGAADVEFTSIPSTYQHLQIRGIVKSTTNNTLYMNYAVNGVAGTSYSSHYLFGNGSSAGSNAGNGASAASMYLGEFPSTAATNTFGAFVLDVLDYKDTNKNTTFRALAADDKNGSGVFGFSSGLFNSTNAITSIKFTPQAGPQIGQYSHFALYGIKG